LLLLLVPPLPLLHAMWFLLLFSISSIPSNTFVMSYILLFWTPRLSAAKFKSRTDVGEEVKRATNFFVRRPRLESYLLPLFPFSVLPPFPPPLLALVPACPWDTISPLVRVERLTGRLSLEFDFLEDFGREGGALRFNGEGVWREFRDWDFVLIV